MKNVKKIGILMLTVLFIALIIACGQRDLSDPFQSTEATTATTEIEDTRELEATTEIEDTSELSKIPIRELGKRQKLQISDSAEIYPAGDVCKIWNGTDFRFDVDYADHLCLDPETPAGQPHYLIETPEQMAIVNEGVFGYCVWDPERGIDWWRYHYPLEFYTLMPLEELRQYPLSEYSYLLKYEGAYSDCGTKYEAESVVIDDNKIFFGWTSDTVLEDDIGDGIRYGYFNDISFSHYAVIPKSVIAGRKFENVIYPGENDLSQRTWGNVKFCYLTGVASDQLAKRYEEYDTYLDPLMWHRVYIIQTQEEYDDFLRLSEGIEFFANREMPKGIDFDENTLFVRFFQTTEKRFWDPAQGFPDFKYDIRNAEIVLDLMEVDSYVRDSEGYYRMYCDIKDRSDCTLTDVLYMVVPKELAALEQKY